VIAFHPARIVAELEPGQPAQQRRLLPTIQSGLSRNSVILVTDATRFWRDAYGAGIYLSALIQVYDELAGAIPHARRVALRF